MEVKAVLFFLVLVIPASIAFQWTSSQIPDGSTFRACVGERASFPWSFSLATGEHVISVEWYRTTGKGQVIVAALVAGHFFPGCRAQNVTFVPGAGLQVGHVSLAEFGTYSVRVNYNNNGSLLSSQQTAFLTMEDAPALEDGQMVASLGPEPLLDDVTGRLHIQLMCGHFLSLGSRPVSVVWKTPSDHTVASTDYINGTFRLNLPHPAQGGGYYCHLKDPSVAARCIPNVSRLMRGAYIHVDEVQIRLTLLEGGLQGLQAKNEKLDREMDRQADLDSELQSREQNLTAEVGRLAEITHMLLTRTEKLTSDNEILKTQTEKLTLNNERLTSDNEKLKTQTENLTTQTQKLTSDTKQLKTQTEKLTSDNQKLTTQAQKLTSDNEILKTQTGKLTSDNEKQKTQTQKLTSDNEQLKTQTQKLTSDNEKLKTQTQKLTSDNEKLKTQTQKLTSDNDGLKSQMQSMASQLTAETAKLSRRVDNMATNTSDMSTQLLTLKSRSDVATKSVGFFAKLNHYKLLNASEILTFLYVTTNEGGAFDGSTGKFTAPVSGTYFFLVNIITSGGSKKKDDTVVYIVVDGARKASAYSSYYSSMPITGSCHGLFRLTQGQKVWVRNVYGDTRFDSESTFTGALLHPDLP